MNKVENKNPAKICLDDFETNSIHENPGSFFI